MNKFLKLDWLMVFTVALLAGIGLAALYSISFVDGNLALNQFKKQVIFIVLGVVIMLTLSFYDYRIFSSYSTRLYFGVVALLAAVIFFGVHVRGTTGWIGMGGFHVQPVEIAKLVIIIFLASFLSKKKTKMSILVRILTSAVLVFIPVFLILKQPDLGSAAVVIGIWLGMLLASGINKKNLFLLSALGIVAMSSSWLLLKDYQKERLINFVNPYNDPRGSGYNVIQSLVAVGSGKFWGKGLGHGSQSQLNFLPEKHTDFIFAVVAEELGFIGSFVVLFLFGILFYRMKEAARLARDNFGYLLSSGIIIMLFLQVFINIGMNIGLAPVTGVPLPFLSYGGSSIVMTFASIGIIQSIRAKRIKSLD